MFCMSKTCAEEELSSVVGSSSGGAVKLLCVSGGDGKKFAPRHV